MSNFSKTGTMQSSIPVVTPAMAKAVSQYRKGTLEEQIERGEFREAGSGSNKQADIYKRTAAGYLVNSRVKTASDPSTSLTANYRGSGGTVRQTPEIYSPLWLTSNLNLPRDRATINAWCRSFFALNPMVHNAITLHSTYPISKLNIKCKNEKVAKFFEQMIEEIDLMNVCVQIAQEYWTLGETFIYAELNNSTAKWSRLLLQNPDYITVKPSVIAEEPIISLRPDENLKRIITSNRPGDIQQRQKLDKSIIEHVKRGENIPLSNFYVSHLARKISPYETRGTGLPVACFKALMLWDELKEAKYAQASNMINPLTLIKVGSQDYKPTPADLEAWREVFECYDEETEVLTEDGFKKYHEIIEAIPVLGTGKFETKIKIGVKVACFEPNTEQMVFMEPTKAFVNKYSGEMYHFKNEKIDLKVTPNHDLWISPRGYEYHGHRSLRKTIWEPWRKEKAENLNLNDYIKLRSQIKWKGHENIKSVSVNGKDIPIELYLEFLGYVLSEGCLYSDKKFQHTVGISQTKYVKEMKNCTDKLSEALGKSYSSRYRSEDSKDWNGIFAGKEIYNHFKEAICGDNGNTLAECKRVPRWIMELSPRLLQIFLDALVLGDGSKNPRKNKITIGFSYYSTSKQLADDVYEIAYRCGYVPTMFVRDSDEYICKEGKNDRLPLYTILWSSNTNKGTFPQLYKTFINSQTKQKTNMLNRVQYNGNVWCLTVPTGLFITRRGGKITVQGNSAQYDRDFKIFTHEAVTVERVGYNSGIVDTSNDFTQLMKEIYIGLMVPSVLFDSGDITYANGSVALDVLRQRYITFRNMLSSWLRRKIFAPIAKINDFYDYVNGEKVLIVPDVDWNHMALFDTGDYIQNLVTLSGDPKRVSVQTLCRSLGLDWEEEKRKIRAEQIQESILAKEKDSLSKMPLAELHTIKSDGEIREILDKLPGEEGEPVPGEAPAEEPLPGELPPPPPPSTPPNSPPGNKT